MVALTGLLAASCGAVVVTPYGGVAATPPQINLVPPAPEGPVPAEEAAVVEETEPIAYDAAPTRLEPAAAVPAAAAPLPSLPAPPPDKVLLGPLPFISQTVNNCGPASLAEVLGFWGVNRSQDEVQSVLRGDGNPYGMTPAGVPSYMASLGLDVLLGTAGTDELVKNLLRAGFPVIVNQTVSDSDLEFHYRPIEGFDDERGMFIASDPLIGPQHAISYGEFDRDWGYTGHRFIVIYPPDKLDKLNAALVAGKWDPAYAEGGGQAQPWSVPGTGGPAPVTTPLMSGKPLGSGWFSGPVKVGFSATDHGGFGVANTSYVIDRQPAQLYRGEFTIKDSGKHTIVFHSVNFSGSREADKTVEVGIDQVPPSTTATVEGARDAGGAYKPGARLTLAASDEAAGVAKTTYSLDGGPIQTYSAPVTLVAGTHTVIYGSSDQAGNLEVQHVLTLTVQPGVAPTSGPAGAVFAATAGAPAPVASPAGMPADGYKVCPLFDPTKANKVGATVTIAVQLCDGAGKNLSSAAVPLTIQSLVGPPGFKPPLPSAFRYDAALAGYQALQPGGLPQSTYALYFTAAGDPAVHMVLFRVG